ALMAGVQDEVDAGEGDDRGQGHQNDEEQPAFESAEANHHRDFTMAASVPWDDGPPLGQSYPAIPFARASRRVSRPPAVATGPAQRAAARRIGTNAPPPLDRSPRPHTLACRSNPSRWA